MSVSGDFSLDFEETAIEKTPCPPTSISRKMTRRVDLNLEKFRQSVIKILNLDMRGNTPTSKLRSTPRPFSVTYLNFGTDREPAEISRAQLIDELNRWEITLNTIPHTNEKETDIILNSLTLIHYLKKKLINQDEDLSNVRFLIAKDPNGKIQAIACCTMVWEGFQKNTLIEMLVSAPHNLAVKYNEGNKDCVRGAGSAIVHHLIKTGLLYKDTWIYLRAYKEAAPFYENLGFDVDTNLDCHFNLLNLREIAF